MALTRSDHYPQLDSLRAFAVIAIVCHHWVHGIPDALQLASAVQLFFVLSGFLITGILLDAKREAANSGGALRTVLGRFYVRRFLRIFPLYYLVLCAAMVVNFPPIRQSWPWHFGYATNFYVIRTGDWIGAISHLWSLAVEEQFYLAWPFLVLFLPNRWLPAVFGIFILIAPAFRWVWNDGMWFVATPASFDSLGLGALVAFYRREALPGFLSRVRWSSPWVAVVGLAAVLPIVGSNVVYTHLGFLALTGLSVIFAWIVNASVNRIPGIVGRVLEFPPLVYLGTISYGVYVLHNFAGFVWTRTKQHVPALPDSFPSILAFNTILTLAGAVILWHGFERPINRLKRRFPYVDSDKMTAGGR